MTPNPLFDIDNSQIDLHLKMPFDEKYRDDSGIDCEEISIELPHKELVDRIVQQVESIFSDENLVRDEFMVKNLRKNKGGFVNLKLLTSLRKVKTISKDWRVVAHALQLASTKLELNENGTKVRRKEPLPPCDPGSKYNRTVFVINLPECKQSIDQLYADFSVFGQISLIRVVRPDSNAQPSHAKLVDHICTNVSSLSKDKSMAAIEYNRTKDALTCMKQQHQLIATDRAWAQVKLCIAPKPSGKPSKPQVCSFPKNTSATTSMALQDLNSHVINKPTDDQLIVITVTSSSVTLSTVPTAPAKRPETMARNRAQNIIRQPHGPDGTKGFKLARR